MSPQSEVTELLVSWRNGNDEALERLVPLVEKELKLMAHRMMRRERKGHTLQTTGLVNEAFIRLVDQKVEWQNRRQFFGLASEIMRRVLINYERDRNRLKRGGDQIRVSITEADLPSDNNLVDLLVLDEALVELEKIDERKCKVVVLRYFGGFSVEETAEIVGVSISTVNNDWEFAKAWLATRLSGKS